MANTPQAKKRIRRNQRACRDQRQPRERIVTLVKKVESALESADKAAAGRSHGGPARAGAVASRAAYSTGHCIAQFGRLTKARRGALR